jgi:hypothetical protein
MLSGGRVEEKPTLIFRWEKKNVTRRVCFRANQTARSPSTAMSAQNDGEKQQIRG